MTIFLAHAEADRASAEALERFLERRGHFVELDNGETALRPVQSSDVVIAMFSKDFAFSPWRLRLEQRALDAWTEGRLILVKLDHSFAPVGLRDLPAIDASFEAQREFTWGDVQKAIQEKLSAPPPPAASEQAEAPGAPVGGARYETVERARRSQVQRKRGAPLRTAFVLLLMLPGFGAIAAGVSIWLVNRIGPTPGSFADLLTGIDGFGARFGIPAGVTPILFAAAIVLMLAAPVFAMLSGASHARKRAKLEQELPELNEDYEAAPSARASEAPDSVFVSYARANAQVVLPVIEGAKQSGRSFWLDQQNLGAGETWAGEIVRAIRGAHDVMVMCSTAAFESDHVKREVYLADRYKKRLVPIYIEEAQPPEDFEYFFAGVQFLKLHETPEGERPAAVLRVLGAA